MIFIYCSCVHGGGAVDDNTNPSSLLVDCRRQRTNLSVCRGVRVVVVGDAGLHRLGGRLASRRRLVYVRTVLLLLGVLSDGKFDVGFRFRGFV